MVATKQGSNYLVSEQLEKFLPLNFHCADFCKPQYAFCAPHSKHGWLCVVLGVVRKPICLCKNKTVKKLAMVEIDDVIMLAITSLQTTTQTSILVNEIAPYSLSAPL